METESVSYVSGPHDMEEIEKTAINFYEYIYAK